MYYIKIPGYETRKSLRLGVFPVLKPTSFSIIIHAALCFVSR